MKYTTSVLTLSLATVSLADDLRARAVPGSNVIPMNFVKERSANYGDIEAGRRRLVRKSLKRRGLDARATSGLILETLDNAQLLYYANITMGTPPQPIRLQIDTGSSDVWANSVDSTFCSSSDQPCDQGSFDSSKSSTFKINGQGLFSINYVDQSGASGDYFTDNFGIGGATITRQTMGLADTSDIEAGIMGVGYDTNEAYLQYSSTPYPSIIDSMVTQKLINSKAYSLWLNDLDSNTGSVLFGGIDTKKYQGSLVGLPLQLTANTDTVTDFAVVLSGVSYTTSSGRVVTVPTTQQAVILDSGSTLMYLPQAMLTAIASGFNAVYSSDAQGYIVNCNVGNSATSVITISFGGSGGTSVNVPLNELVLPATTTSGDQATDSEGNPICTFGIQASSPGDDLLFGDTFLRSAYVVYDLSKDMLYVAQTVFNQTESNVMEITEASGVPDVSGVASGASAIVTGTTARPRPTTTVTGVGAGTTATTSSTSKAAAVPGVQHSVQFGYMLPLMSVVLCAMIGGGAVLL